MLNEMWLNSPTNLVLHEDQVDIWGAELDIKESLETLFINFLSPDEKHRADRYKFNHHRTGFIAARGILRSLLGRYLQISPAKIIFNYNSYGKPALANDSTVQFNISHSANLALFAFTKRRAIGIDLEYILPDIEIKALAADFFSPNEVRVLMSLPEKEQKAAFFNCWTRKEAFIKAVGSGLSFPLQQFDVSLTLGEPAKLLATYWNAEDVSNWSLRCLFPATGFAGALALEGNVESFNYWRWHEYDAPLLENLVIGQTRLD